MSYSSLVSQGESDMLAILGVDVEFRRLGRKHTQCKGILTQGEALYSIELGGAEMHVSARLIVAKSCFTPHEYMPCVGDTVQHGGDRYTIVKCGADALEGVLHLDLSR